MSENIIYEHETVSLCQNARYLWLTWRGTIELEVYQKVLNLALKVVEQQNIHQFLIDQRALEFVGIEAQAWLTLRWFPELEKAANQKVQMAIVTAKKLFVKVASETVAKRLSHNKDFCTIQYFESIEAAENWLASSD